MLREGSSRHRVREARLGLIVALGVVLAILVVLDRFAVALLRPRRRAPGRTPGALGLRSRDWIVQGQPPLNGWWVDGEDPSGPLVLVVHGWGANAAVTLPLVQAAAGVASHVLTYDLRGHGRNSVWPTVSLRTFQSDVERGVEAIREKAPRRPLVVIGHSMGGAGAILASAAGAPISGVLVVAAPYHIHDVIVTHLNDLGLPGRFIVPLLRPFWRLRIGVPEREIHPGKAAARLDVPFRVIHPEEDTRVVIAEGEALAGAAAATLVRVPGAGHTDVLDRPETAAEIVRFLREVAPGERPSGTGDPA
ncbi:MAG TPA: alpha/beta fold hydrolase [Longimicrobiales bacterium]|nr:alpha/beta fold hydrolase [Longimicrobiales bacterium]